MASPSTSITYRFAPLVEVAISVQFGVPRGLTQAHLGAYWALQKSDFPNIHSTQGLPVINENFEKNRPWLPPALRLALSHEPDTRVQMTSADKAWVQQVQANRLVINWRTDESATATYPRFEGAWQRFQSAWNAWSEFLGSVKIAAPRPTVWEVVYVNRIPQGDLWETPADWPSIFPGLWAGPFAGLSGATLSGIQGQWVWESDNPPARLYVEPKPGRGASPAYKKLLLVTLTARGQMALSPKDSPSETSTTKAIESGVRHGHDLIVGAFDALNSDNAKTRWGRTCQ